MTNELGFTSGLPLASCLQLALPFWSSALLATGPCPEHSEVRQAETIRSHYRFGDARLLVVCHGVHASQCTVGLCHGQ